jgi:hypothetical protein
MPSPNPSPDPNTTITPSLPTDKDNQPDHTWPIGSLIYYDNICPISPASIEEGYTQLLVFRDTRSKYIFSYPVKTCNEDIFVNYLRKVLRFFTTRASHQPQNVATSTAPSAPHSPRSSTRPTTAPIRLLPPTNNGKMQPSVTSRPSSPICPSPYTAKTSFVPTPGHTLPNTGHASTTLSHTP